jgi:hypothetical protein
LIAAGSNALRRRDGGNWGSADIGKTVWLPGAGSGGTVWNATVKSLNGATEAILSSNAPDGIGGGQFGITYVSVVIPGDGVHSWAPGEVAPFTGGAGDPGQIMVKTTTVMSATVAAGGSGGTPNSIQIVTGMTGIGLPVRANVSINSAGGIGAVNSIVYGGLYTENPTSLSAEPVAGGGLSGAKLRLVMGAADVWIPRPGNYTAGPTGIGRGNISGRGLVVAGLNGGSLIASTAHAGGVLAVTATSVPLGPEMDVYGTNVPAGTAIAVQLSGAPGGIGTYELNLAQNSVPSEAMTASPNHRYFGAWGYGTDDTATLQDEIDALEEAGGGVDRWPTNRKGYCAITRPLVINGNGITLRGNGIGGNSGGVSFLSPLLYPNADAQSALLWFGPRGGKMVDVEPAADAAYGISWFGLDKIALVGLNSAGYGLYMRSVAGGYLYTIAEHQLLASIDISSANANTVKYGVGVQRLVVPFLAAEDEYAPDVAGATGILINGFNPAAGNADNTSTNHFGFVWSATGNAPAVDLRDLDADLFDHVQAWDELKTPQGNPYGLVVRGIGLGFYRTRFVNLGTFWGSGIWAQAGSGPNYVTIGVGDTGTPPPQIDPGAQLGWQDLSGQGSATAPADQALNCNGDMAIDQASEGAAVYADNAPAGIAYSVDCWALNPNGGGNIQAQRLEASPPPGERYYLRLSVRAPGTAEAAVSRQFCTSIDGADMRSLGFGANSAVPLNVSFQLRASSAGPWPLYLGSATNARVFPLVADIANAGDWERFNFAMPGDAGFPRAWALVPGADGMDLCFDAGSGPDFQGAAADRWQNGPRPRIPANANRLATLRGGTLDIAQVRVWPGDAGNLDFAARPYAEELLLAERRYRKTFPPGIAPAQNAGMAGALCDLAPATGSLASVYWKLDPPMVATPRVTTYNPSAANANWRIASGPAAGRDLMVKVDPARATSPGGVQITSATPMPAANDACIHAVLDARFP